MATAAMFFRGFEIGFDSMNERAAVVLTGERPMDVTQALVPIAPAECDRFDLQAMGRVCHPFQNAVMATSA